MFLLYKLLLTLHYILLLEILMIWKKKSFLSKLLTIKTALNIRKIKVLIEM